MGRAFGFLLGIGAIGGIAYFLLRSQNANAAVEQGGWPGVASIEDFLGGLTSSTSTIDNKQDAQNIMTISKSWNTPSSGMVYEPYFQQATDKYGLPPGLLSRMAYQESRYNPNAISPAGAIGLMQFEPDTARQFGINPKDPIASIDAAGKYMQQLYQKFGSWTDALAAYNWGQGNVARKGISKAPIETRNYFSQILADIGIIN